jgi:predicted nucleic acid-binding protein
VRVFLDTWVLIEKYKGNPDAEGLLEAAKSEHEAHISLITVAELMNVISREYGEREARVQHAYLRRSPLIREPVTEEIARDAGLLKTRYRFSLADALILSTAMARKADVLLTGGDKQYEKEWKDVTEMQVLKLSDFMKNSSLVQ